MWRYVSLPGVNGLIRMLFQCYFFVIFHCNITMLKLELAYTLHLDVTFPCNNFISTIVQILWQKKWPLNESTSIAYKKNHEMIIKYYFSRSSNFVACVQPPTLRFFFFFLRRVGDDLHSKTALINVGLGFRINCSHWKRWWKRFEI